MLKAPWLENLKDGSFNYGCDKSLTSGGNEIPLPSLDMRKTVSRPDLPGFYFIGETWAYQLSLILSEIKPKKRNSPLLLDIGCGVGKTARFLAIDQTIRYVGFDIFKPAIEWANTYLVPKIGTRFKFEHYDGSSDFYNPGGKIAVEDYEFPVEDGSVDLMFAASLFTHLHERDCASYLSQTKKKLAPGGRALYSIKEPREGEGDYCGSSEAAIRISVEYFEKMCVEQGLIVIKNLGSLAGQTGLLISHG